MSKVRLIIDVEIDEEELSRVENYKDNYEPSLTKEEYLDGLKFEFEYGKIIISNEIEDYFNENLGDSQVLNEAKLISKEIIE